MEIVNDWFGLSPNLDDFTRGRYDACELVLPLEDADGESTANKSKK
jgi:hypothetical protein